MSPESNELLNMRKVKVSFINITRMLSDKLKALVELKHEMTRIQSKQSALRLQYTKNAYSNPELTNETLRENYIKGQLNMEASTKERKELEYKIAVTDADMKGLEYEWKSKKVLIEANTEELKFMQE